MNDITMTKVTLKFYTA